MAKKITTFLLADDDDDFVFFARRAFFQDLPHLNLRVVGNGLEVQKYLEGVGRYADRTAYPLPKVILLDLKMPLLNGFEFLEWRARASEAVRHIPIVVMANSPLEVDINRAYTLGANSYMVKPSQWAHMKNQFEALSMWCDNITPDAIIIEPNFIEPKIIEPPAENI